MSSISDVAGLKHIAIDGKCVRGSIRDNATQCLNLVSAWVTNNSITLGQVVVDDDSNEITAIPELLRLLVLHGAIVTIDAAGCQTENARIIIERGGDYLLAVKGNQAGLLAESERVLTKACDDDFRNVSYDCHSEETMGHGRREARHVTVIYNPKMELKSWLGAKSLVVVNRDREVLSGCGGDSLLESTTHFYLSSRKCTAAEFGVLTKGHWGIENGLHGTLDVVMGEDASATLNGTAAANLAMVCRVAVSLLKRSGIQETLPTQMHMAAVSDEVLSHIVNGRPKYRA